MAATDLEGSRGRIRFDKNGDPTFVTHVVKVVNGKETDARKQ
jgi:branched-chain amino acid transport system substrate-binding protein